MDRIVGHDLVVWLSSDKPDLDSTRLHMSLSTFFAPKGAGAWCEIWQKFILTDFKVLLKPMWIFHTHWTSLGRMPSTHSHHFRFSDLLLLLSGARIIFFFRETACTKKKHVVTALLFDTRTCKQCHFIFPISLEVLNVSKFVWNLFFFFFFLPKHTETLEMPFVYPVNLCCY